MCTSHEVVVIRGFSGERGNHFITNHKTYVYSVQVGVNWSGMYIVAAEKNHFEFKS